VGVIMTSTTHCTVNALCVLARFVVRACASIFFSSDDDDDCPRNRLGSITSPSDVELKHLQKRKALFSTGGQQLDNDNGERDYGLGRRTLSEV